jgi:hypothetical protein
MRKDAVIRSGDSVRIEKPLFLNRVGYPKCIESESEIVVKEFGEDIRTLLLKAGVSEAGIIGGGFLKDWIYIRLRDRIINGIAHARLRSHGFGGRNREIYTDEIPEFDGKIFRVAGTRFVKTGTYYPSTGGGEWEDYDPAVLDDQKTHKILCLDWFCIGGDIPALKGRKSLEIEACHVIKV